jgi:antitoxin HigA-1
MGLTQAALAEAIGVARKHVNSLCNDRGKVTVPELDQGLIAT